MEDTHSPQLILSWAGSITLCQMNYCPRKIQFAKSHEWVLCCWKNKNPQNIILFPSTWRCHKFTFMYLLTVLLGAQTFLFLWFLDIFRLQWQVWNWEGEEDYTTSNPRYYYSRCLFVSLSLYLSVSLSASLLLCLCLSVSLSASLSLPLSAFLPLSLSLSHTHAHTHIADESKIFGGYGLCCLLVSHIREDSWYAERESSQYCKLGCIPSYLCNP